MTTATSIADFAFSMEDKMTSSTARTLAASWRVSGRRLLLTVAALMTLIVTAPGVASAAAGPVWDVDQAVYPTVVVPGTEATISVALDNIGAAPSTGPVSVTADLPAGMTFVYGGDGYSWSCSSAPGASTVSCTYFPAVLAHTPTTAALAFRVAVAAGTASLGPVRASASGGGASPSSIDEITPQLGAGDGPFGIAGFSGKAINLDGTPAHQAADHPDVTTVLTFPGDASGRVIGNPRDIDVDLPAGLVGNPQAVPTCAVELLSGDNRGVPFCPPETQVGIVYLQVGGLVGSSPTQIGLHNVEPPAGLPARFAFNYRGAIVNFDPVVRTGGDYGITVRVSKTSQSIGLVGAKVTLWGVPADPVHDDQRLAPLSGGQRIPPASSSAQPVPFITVPTECSGKALATRITVDTWAEPDVKKSAVFDTNFDGSPLTVEGCDRLAFTPTVKAVPTTLLPDAPTGLSVSIDSPQNLESPKGLAAAQLRNVTVTLPEGMTINPGSADGLGACTDSQLGLSSADEPSCPDSARIGTVSAKSPLLKEELTGGVYIRSQASSDPESGDMFRMAIVLESKERGILVKLPGSIRVNKDSGRIVTEFKNNPQLPVEQIKLSLKSGPRAPLATPATCGTKTIDTELTSWAGNDVQTKASFDIACTAGLGGFSPVLSAGTTNPAGGAFSPFALNIKKPDGDADLNGLTMSLPTGLLASLKGNLGTQIGTVKTYAGPGSNPFVLPGKVYLEGAYDDAPFSLRVVVPAVAGPFDLGEVVVRQKIYVDPIDAHVTVVSDPVPTIVKGVPVRLQRLEVNIDKPGFIINPTSCAAKTISGTLSAAGGQTAAVTNRFQVGDCASLALKPSLALTLSGKGQTTDGKHPAVTANLTQKPGQANLKKVRVALPLSLALDTDNANGLCEFVDGSKTTPTCPKNSIVGTATATTPILDEPLNGPVYFVKNVRKDPKSGRNIRTLPKLVIPLVGQNGVKLTLTGTSDVENDQLVTTFNNIPDAPVSSFKLNIIGGKGGILAVSGADICKATQTADQQINGQNNKNANTDVYIQTPNCPTKILSKKVTAKTVRLKIGGLGAGKVTVTGKGIKKTTKTIAKSTVATITAKRTGKSKPGAFKVKFTKAKAPVA
jgi:hypothetical protein